VDVYLATGNFAPFRLEIPTVLMVRNPTLFPTEIPLKRRGSMIFRMEQGIRSALCRRSVRLSQAAICPTEDFCQVVRRAVPRQAQKVHTVHHGFDTGAFMEAEDLSADTAEKVLPQLRPGSLKLLYVSVFQPHKNHEVLLRALPSIEDGLDRPVDLILTIREDQLPASVRRHPGRVICAGSVPYQDVYPLHRTADIFVFPSIWETFGHPLVEAMAAGTPTAASNIGVCQEICGGAAWYFDPRDPKALAGTVIDMAGDREEVKGRVQVGIERAETFSWQRHWSELRDFLQTRVAAGR
jgi:glycosyltransferase involved in cell wall biosynthesis